MNDATPFCVRCSEDFPVSVSRSWQMGTMRPLADAPARIRLLFNEWLRPDSLVETPYLCGNCYFDLTDS